MLAALSVTHGYLPPHPAPTAIVTLFHADLGKTLIYGIIVAIPAIIISGPYPVKSPEQNRCKAIRGIFKSESND